MRIRTALLGAGTLGAGLVAALAPRSALHAAAATWRPFLLVAGLLLIGVVAGEDGVFAWVASLLDRFARRRLLVYLVCMALVAVVTALLNLDTSVAFLTPVLIHVGRRGGGGQRLLYGCVFMSNAASLLLPGSNLTNLLVLANEHASGSEFLAHMLLPWSAAVVVTAVVVGVALRPGDDRAGEIVSGPRSPAPRLLSLVGIGVAIAVMLVFSDSAALVAGVGVSLAAVRLGQQRIGTGQIRDGVDVASLAGVFGIAVSLGALARTWSYPAHLMMRAGSTATAGLGALSSVLINNLPAAVLLGSRMPAHPQSLLFGLNIGPNLAVTGSLSALIWWQAARSVGARPSVLRYSAVGVVLVPLTLSAALLAARVVA
jgi:arsenical pump membrane protein